MRNGVVVVLGLLAHALMLSLCGMSPSHWLALLAFHAVCFVLPFVPLLLLIDGRSAVAAAGVLSFGTVLGTWAFWAADWLGLIGAVAAVMILLSAVIVFRARARIRAWALGRDTDILASCVLSIAVFVMIVLPTAGDGALRSDGSLVYRTQDASHFVGITKQCVHHPRPPAVNFAQMPLSYHYFMQYYLSLCSRLTGIGVEEIFAYWPRYLFTFALLASLLVFLRDAGLPGPWIAAGAAFFFGAHGINTFHSWLEQILQGRYSTEYFFHPLWGTRQFAMIFSFGSCFQMSMLLALLLILKRRIGAGQGVLLGVILGLSAMFHISALVPLLLALYASCLLLVRTDRRAGLWALAAAATLVFVLLLKSTLLSLGGGRTYILPTAESVLQQCRLLMLSFKWLGVEIAGYAVCVFLLVRRREWDPASVVMALLTVIGPAMALVYNIEGADKDFIGFQAFSYYLMALPSMLLPLYLVRGTFHLWSARPALRFAAVGLLAIWIAQLAGGVLNVAGIIGSRGINAVVSAAIVQPLKRLEAEGRPRAVIVSNSMLSSEPLVSNCSLVAALSGMPVMLEVPLFFNLTRHPAYDRTLERMKTVFSSSDASVVRRICVEEKAGYIVEWTSGPRMDTTVAAGLPLIAASEKVRIYRVPE